MNNTLEMPTTFDFKPLEKVLFTDDGPETIAGSIDRAMHMLVTVDQSWFKKSEIATCYEDLKNLRDAIRKGGQPCQ